MNNVLKIQTPVAYTPGHSPFSPFTPQTYKYYSEENYIKSSTEVFTKRYLAELKQHFAGEKWFPLSPTPFPLLCTQDGFFYMGWTGPAPQE